MELVALRQRIRFAVENSEPDVNLAEVFPKTLFSGWVASQPPSKYRVSYSLEHKPRKAEAVADVIIEFFTPSRADDRGRLSVVIDWDMGLGDLGQPAVLKAQRYWFKNAEGGASYYGDDAVTGIAEAKVCVQALLAHLGEAKAAEEDSRELPSTWKHSRVQVALGGGWKAVPAWRLLTLAVHESIAGNGWAISHAPTGMLMGQDLGDDRSAKKAAEKVLKQFPGLALAMDKESAIAAVKAGGGPAKFKSLLSAARRSGPRQPWQSSWTRDMKAALIAYDQKLNKKDPVSNPHRIALLLKALDEVEAEMKKQGDQGSLGDLKRLVVEHFTAETMPEIKRLFKAWGDPWSPEDDRAVHVRDRMLLRGL